MGNVSSSTPWSIEAYCAQQEAQLLVSSQHSLPDSSRAFLQVLGLPVLHPFCTEFAGRWDDYYQDDVLPRQGPLQTNVHANLGEYLVTLWTAVVPALAAMGELWLRLFASVLAPMGILVLLYQATRPKVLLLQDDHRNEPWMLLWIQEWIQPYLSAVCLLTVAASVVLMTDTLYVLEWGPAVGATCLAMATALAGSVWRRYHLPLRTQYAVWALWALTAHLITTSIDSPWNFGDPADTVTNIPEGLYFAKHNAWIDKIVTSWSVDDYSYNMGTPWMPTGDSRTGLPFLLNHVAVPDYTRVWLPVDNATEAVALDIALPDTGYDPTQPMYLVLHGLNGGSSEEYVRDFVWRQTARNATVVVMVARGLMDTPVRGWNNFHGARWTDAHEAAMVLKQRVVGRTEMTTQPLIGVGYSMGAIILSNMVVQTGLDCALDAAVAISGGLDMRQQEHFPRAQRLWQPILTKELRQTFLLGKWGERVRKRLSHATFMAMLRATHITEVDASAVVGYNGFHDVVDYYTHMSALGDIPLQDELLNPHGKISPHRQIHQLAVPLLVVQAMDDPLITWRTVASNHGPMHPSNLTRTGKGNLMLLLTKKGGHVGWPLGWFPHLYTWHWMNEVPASFAKSIQENMPLRQKREQTVQEAIADTE